MDVCLTNYGHCNYVSGKHACIFYDEVSVIRNYASLKALGKLILIELSRFNISREMNASKCNLISLRTRSIMSF